MSVTVGLLGALAGVDRTAFGLTQLSHPVVIGSVFLLVFGASPSALLFLGVLTCLEAATIPVGPVRRPDFSSATLVGLQLGALHPSPAGWALALLCSVGVATVGIWSVEGVYFLARASTARVDAARHRGDGAALERLHLGLTALHALRGAVVVIVGLTITKPLVARALEVAGERGGVEFLAGIWTVAPWAALPVLCRLHWAARGRRVPVLGMSVLLVAFWLQTWGWGP